MSKEFKISIIVNCFNGEKYLSRCLQSIINQTVNNWELIFFDNKSNDLSKEIFKKFNDKRFKYFSSTHFMKLYEARNEAVKNISGDFIAFLDCDDWWEPFHLENANPFFLNEHLGFYYSNAFNYYEKKKKFNLHKNSLPKKDVFESLIDDYSVKISSLILRRSFLENFGNSIFDKNYNIIGDYDLVIKIASQYECFANDIPSVNCSFHGDNYSLKNRDEYVDEFNMWYEKIDFNNQKFLSNKSIIKDNLFYINLFRNITANKELKYLIQIFKVKKFLKKIKLFTIFIMPKFIIKKYLNRY